MRGMRVLAMVLATAVAAAGCGGGGDDDDEDATATTVAPATTSPAPSTTAPGTTLPATSLTLRITDVRLLNTDEADNAVRILLPAGVASASVTLTGGLPSPNRSVSVCQTRELDRKLSTAACRMPASGEAVNVTLGSTASGVEIQQAVAGGGSAGSATILDEVVIRYTASSREVNVRLPQIASGDSGGRPSFALTPAGPGGRYRATLNWLVIQVFGGTPSMGRLEVVQGGSVVNQAEGGGLEVRLDGALPAAGEAAIRIVNAGSSALVSPKLALVMP